MKGKMVFEVLPDIDWDKGKAIQWIMKSLGISWSESLVIYIGDDVTDEYAFRTIRTRGTGILVTEIDNPSAADFKLNSPLEVKKLFNDVFRIK
ncbi:MAG: trehalose-phosphatase, partial [Candidatus Omnitrophica bacterium]|nr:trehalose-phosphatase [Candidatus Omnitrophota bacterium]